MSRHFWVLVHRYVGLAMTAFLVVVGLTGAILAFWPELNRIVTPGLFPPAVACSSLGPATFAERAESLAPQVRVRSVYLGEPGIAIVWVDPRPDAANGQADAIGFNQMFLDVCTGTEIGRRKVGGLVSGWDNLMPFVYRLHYALSLGEIGGWIMGGTALVWTLDCFVSFYLTFPARRRSRRSSEATPIASSRSWWQRWKPAWLVQWRSSSYRINFDLHRAGGLWLWALLLVFAWSSVMFNLHEQIYLPTMRIFFHMPSEVDLPERPQAIDKPGLDWQQAQSTAQRLMAEQARLNAFAVERPISLNLDTERGLYFYAVRSSRDIQDRRGRTWIYFDADSGELRHVHIPTGQYAGITISTWLAMLHEGNVFGFAYRLIVCVLGLAIVMLCVTGLVIWLKKRHARARGRNRQCDLDPQRNLDRKAVQSSSS